jgi:hypothetical protein
MDDSRFPENKILALKRFHKTLKAKREADKVKAVYSLGSGHPVKLTAEVLDLNERTVRQYFLDYQKQDEKNRKKRQWIQLDISYKKPKVVLGKLDNHLQNLFLRKYRRILKTNGENDVVLFADAVHLAYQMAASYGWIKKGTEKEFKTNSDRERVNINGAIDIHSLQMTVDFSDSINGASTIRLLEKLNRLYPLSEKIHIIPFSLKNLAFEIRLNPENVEFPYL